jgi:hypothetical protein
VRVSIPNGDYTQDKYIEGKYVSNNDITPITYVSTLDSIVRMGDLSSNLENVTGELVANGNIKEVAIGYINLAADSESKDLQENSIYDTFFL